MALPAVRNLRTEFSESELTLLVCGITPPYLEDEADRLLSIPASSTLQLLRASLRGFDTCFVNSIGIFDVRCDLMAFLTGAPDLRGPMHRSQGAARTVYSRPYVFGEGHETVVNLRGSGGRTDAQTLDYPLHWHESGAGCAAPDLLLHPGSSETGLINRWPPEFYAEVARAFHAKGRSVLAIGSPREKALLEDLREKAQGAVHIRHDLQLQELVPLLAGAGLVIANDSGIGHLAAAAGANLLTIMGANRPEQVAPVGDDVFVMGPRCEFGGCYGTAQASQCKLCIRAISPREVLEEAWEKWRPAMPS